MMKENKILNQRFVDGRLRSTKEEFARALVKLEDLEEKGKLMETEF